MLSAFTARPIIELKQQTRSKIETILAHGTSMPHAQYSVAVVILLTATFMILSVPNSYVQVTAFSSALTMAPFGSIV